MSKTQIFIEKARAKHGDRYSYDRVVYVRSGDKIIITCKQHGDFEQIPNNHLNGQGCAKCAGSHRYSTQEWIQEAVAVHGDRYGYDRVVYVRARDKVIITCAKHGDFEQRPSDHLNGRGCARCGLESTAAKKTQKAKGGFIEKARAKHGDRYGYGRVVYVRNKDRVTITCKKHGDFEQRLNDHLNGQGCAKCSGKYNYSTQEWIQEAIGVHGDLYDYLKTVYVRSKSKVIITCAKHGDFEQIPSDHLNGRGCAKCGKESTAIKLSEEPKNSFIERSRAVHGDLYNYSKVFYTRNKDKVVITCKQHGDFEQTPNCHLSGQGCPSCPARRDQPTNLYLMHNGLGKVKVGYAIDLNRRMTELNSTTPFEAELLETWTLPDTPTVRKIESKVHRKLAKYHAGLSGFDGATEWFNVSPERAKSAINEMLIMSRSAILNHTIANQPQLSLF